MVDHSMETVLPRILDSRTRGLLRRIMRRVLAVMGVMVPDEKEMLRDQSLMLMI